MQNKFKHVNHPNLNKEDLQALAEEPDTPEQDHPVGRKGITELFEKTYAKQLDLTPSDVTHRKYKDTTTDAMHQAFQHSFKEMRKSIIRSIRLPKQERMTELYINGLIVEDHTVQFSKRPYQFHKEQKARDEAIKLSQKHGGQFAVFKAMSLHGEKPVAVPQTKQKEKGRHKPSIEVVLNNLKNVLQHWILFNVQTSVLPTGFAILPSGDYCVQYTNGKEVQLENLEAAIELIKVECATYVKETNFLEWYKENNPKPAAEAKA